MNFTRRFVSKATGLWRIQNGDMGMNEDAQKILDYCACETIMAYIIADMFQRYRRCGEIRKAIVSGR